MSLLDFYLPLLLLAIPLIVSVFIALFLRRLGGLASLCSVAAAVAIAAVAGHMIFRSGEISFSVPWLTLGKFSLSLGFLLYR